MSLYVYTVSVLAAIFWGITPVISKRGFETGGGPLLMALMTVIVGNVIFWPVVFYLNGGHVPVFAITPYGVAVFIAAGLVGTTVGRIVMFTGIDRVGASVNTAITATHPLFAVIIATIVLREPISIQESIGTMVIIFGLMFISLSRGGDIRGWNLRDLWFSVASAIAFGIGTVLRRYGLTISDVASLEGAAINLIGALLGFVTYLVLANKRSVFRASRETYIYFVVTGVFSSFALLFLFMGLSVGRVVVVAPIVGTSPLVATTLTYLLLDDLERVTYGIVIATVIIVFGIVILTTG